MNRRDIVRARARLQAAVREFLAGRGFDEVETPCLVPAPGMEPHIDAFAAPFLPGGAGPSRPLWLHTSPEYAMKRLVAEGFPRIFQLARVFRNGEVGATHNPEFTMLELYRAGTDYTGIMSDLEQLIVRRELAVKGFAHTAHYDSAISADKTIAFEEGAVHGGTPCLPCATLIDPTITTQAQANAYWGDTFKRTMDFYSEWLSARY